MALLKHGQDERLKLLERRLTGQELSKDACEQLTSLLLTETSQEPFPETDGPQRNQAAADPSKRRQSREASPPPRKKRRSLGTGDPFPFLTAAAKKAVKRLSEYNS